MSLCFSQESPAEIIALELGAGARGRIDSVIPDGDECDHVAALLRRGSTSGIGLVMWELRAPVGVRFPQTILDSIAASVEDAVMEGEVELVEADGGPGPCVGWRLVVRR